MVVMAMLMSGIPREMGLLMSHQPSLQILAMMLQITTLISSWEILMEMVKLI